MFVNDIECYNEVTDVVPRDRVSIVPPSTDTERFQYYPPPAIEDSFNLLFASAPMKPGLYPDIFMWKGIDVLLDSIEKINSDINIKLFLLWRDTYLDEVKHMIKDRDLDNVVLVNDIVDMSKYYRKAHVTVFPARNTMFSPCFPSTIMESLSVGRPVIVSDKLHISSIIDETQSGIVCEPTEESFSNSIKLLMENYSKFQYNCRGCAEEYFNKQVNFGILREYISDRMEDIQ